MKCLSNPPNNSFIYKSTNINTIGFFSKIGADDSFLQTESCISNINRNCFYNIKEFNHSLDDNNLIKVKRQRHIRLNRCIFRHNISNYNDWQKTLIARYTVLNHITTDQCIIVDASIQIKKSLSKFIDLNSINDVGFVIHPFRESYLDEFDEWIKTRNLDYQQKEDFINFCNKHAFDYNNAKCFIMSTVMFIRKTDTTISLFNTVLNELMNNYDFSIRIDQLYLSVIFFRYYPEIIREYYSYQILNSDYFSYHYHNSELTHEGDYDYDLSKLEIRNVYYKNSLCKYLT